MIRLMKVLGWLCAASIVAVLVGPFAWSAVSGDSFMRVTGTSMEPAYQVGDVLLVQRPDGTELDTIGNPVVVTATPRATHTQYVHRVHEIRPDGAILKGDNNDVADPGVVTTEHVVGAPRFALTGPAAFTYELTQWWPVRVAGILAILVAMLLPTRTRRPRQTSPDPRSTRDLQLPTAVTPREENHR